jgi:hypothetical protein
LQVILFSEMKYDLIQIIFNHLASGFTYKQNTIYSKLLNLTKSNQT